MSNACEQVRRRLGSPDAARRLGQALWMMSGEPFTSADLVWAQGLLGQGAEQLLLEALREAGCCEGATQPPNIRALGNFLCFLLEGNADNEPTGLVWTFPTQTLSVPGISGDSYAKAVSRLIELASRSLTVVSPYIEARGVGVLEEAMVTALFRGVNTVVITHDAQDLSSMSSAGLRSLRTAAAGLPGSLAVYTTSPKGVLMHMKAVIADGTRGLVGSANMTGKGFTGNVETGVHVGQQDAQEIQRVVDALVASGLAEHVFST